MADGVAITAGSGTTILTDDTGAGGHAQVVKLAIATDGSGTLVPSDGTDGLLVNLGANNDVTIGSALPAGTNAIGKLAANSGVDIGDVDVTSIPGTAAEAAALPSVFVVVAADDGTDTQPLQLSAGGDLKITLDSETVALAAGTNNIGDVDILSIAAGDNNIGNVDVVTLPALAAGTNNIGDVDVLTLPATAGAAASTMNASSSDGATALTSTAQAIKASAGVLYGYFIYNPNSTAQFVQFYNTAQGSVTVGTTTPLFMLTIPPTSAANLWMQPGGITFGTAMSWSATSTAGGNGAPTTALDAVCWFV